MRELSRERWRQIDDLFAAALDKPRGERPAFLAAACGADADLRREVEALLETEVEAAEKLGDSALEFAAPLLPGLESELRGPKDAGHQPGELIGPYRLLGTLGHGGMGTVYLAERIDGEYHRRVALKLVRRGMDTEEILRRFRYERQILASLEHSHIARLYDAGATPDGQPFLVMEYVDGQPIDTHCDARRLTIDERLDLFRQVCEAVHHAHRNLVVHRDLKPSNILVTADGTVKLLDFGIAKVLSTEEPGLTMTSARLWTPAYASPEQVRGAAITTATDVYSLGVLLYELLTGASPYGNLSAAQGIAIDRILETEPERPSTIAAVCSDKAAAARRVSGRHLARKLRGDLDTIVLKALQKSPQRRYATVDRLAADIENYRRGLPVSARPETVYYRLGKWAGRHRLAVVATTLGLLLLAGLSAFTTSAFLRVVMFVLLAGGVVLAAVLFAAAERARRAARQFQVLAEAHRTKADQVSAFLKDMLSSIHPDLARGQDTSLLRELLRRASQRVESELADQPQVAAEIHRTIGSTYLSLSLFDLAESHLRAAESLQGVEEDPVAWCDTQLALAMLHFRQGRYDRAQAILNAAEGAVPEWDPVRKTELLRYRAKLFETAGNPEGAEAGFRELLQFVLTNFPSDHIEVGLAWHALGAFLTFYAGREEGERALRAAIAVLGRPRYRGGASYLAAMNALGTNLVNGKRYAEAEPIYVELVASARRTLGDEHVEMGAYLNGYARLCELKREFSAAEKFYKEALGINERAFGSHHRDVGTSWNNLAFLYLQEGRYAESDRCYRAAIDIYEMVLGKEHPWVAFARENHAFALLEKGDLEAAEANLGWALGLPRERIERIANFEAICECLLGACRAELGDDAQARPLLEKRLPELAAAYGSSHLLVRAGTRRLADILARAGEMAAAERLRAEGGQTDSPFAAPAGS